MALLLTDAQIQEIAQIVRDHHSAFIANVLDPKLVAQDMLDRLQKKGLLNTKVNSVQDAYLYGQILASVDDPKLATMSYDDFKRYMRQHPVPLSEIEREAIDAANLRAAQYVKGLGNRVDLSTGQLLIEADQKLRQQMRDEIKTATASNLAKRESLKKLKSDLGWATEDWSRDWDRIAVTEKHTAMQEGTAGWIGKRYGGDAIVFKRPMPDACEHCKRLHLGPDGYPRLFTLAFLEGNGHNAGKKASQWLPTVGSVHPHCQCQLVRMPSGWGFNEAGEIEPGGPYGVMYENESELEMALREEHDLRKSLIEGGYADYQGLPLNIEHPAGSVRKWRHGDESGETHMLYAYGEIQGTKGADDDPIDVYVGPDPRAPVAYQVHQQNPDNGLYDEVKIMLGFSSEGTAVAAYKAHYNRPGFMVAVDPIEIDHLKRLVRGPHDGLLAKGPRLIVQTLQKAGTTPGKRAPKLVLDQYQPLTDGKTFYHSAEEVRMVTQEFQKAGPFIGPKGGKWEDAAHTRHWDPQHERTQSVQEFVDGPGGVKIREHEGDPTKWMVKVPHERAKELAALKQTHNIADEIVVGSKYVMLAIPKNLLSKKESEKPTKKPPKKVLPIEKQLHAKATFKVPPYATAVKWSAPKTAAEGEAWCATHGIAASFPDVETAHAVTEALSEQHPAILKHVRFIGTPEQLNVWAKKNPELNKLSIEGKHALDLATKNPLGGSAVAVAHPLGEKPYKHSVVVVRPSYWNKDKVKHDAKPNVGTFSVSENLGDIVRHELGHVEGFQMRSLEVPEQGDKSMWDVWKIYANQLLKTKKAEVMNYVSDYAATNSHELWAELSVLRRKNWPIVSFLQEIIDKMHVDKGPWTNYHGEQV